MSHYDNADDEIEVTLWWHLDSADVPDNDVSWSDYEEAVGGGEDDM